MARILIADDQPEILHALRLLLKQEGFETVMAGSPDAALEEARKRAFDLILIDLNYTRDTTSGREGLDLLKQLRETEGAPPVIVMTAWSTVPLAVEAMQRGAVDFIQKPWENSRLLEMVMTQMARSTRPAPSAAKKQDLEIARSVQARLLPQVRPSLETVDYAVKYVPAGQVGGDYYDFLTVEGGVAFAVADVSGKGISAAILMATIQSFFRSRMPDEFRNLKALAESLNALFYGSSPAEQFATLFLMRYDEWNRSVHYMNCGHTPALLVRRKGDMSELNATATVLGLFETWSGQEAQCVLDEGDTLLVFSDGLTEALDGRNEEFGVDRIAEACREAGECPAEELVERIAESLRQHTRDSLTDDLTILALRARSSKPDEAGGNLIGQDAGAGALSGTR